MMGSQFEVALNQRNWIIKNIFICSLYSIFLFIPWYFHASGQIQPVDIAILLLTIAFFGRNVAQGDLIHLDKIYHSKIYLIISSILIYAVLRLAIGYILGDLSGNFAVFAISNNLYYLLMLTLFTSVFFYLYQSYSLEEFYQILLNCILISTVLPLGTLLLFGSDYGLDKLRLAEPTVVRPVLTFNNANQLGFFAFVNLSLFVYLNLFMKEYGIKTKKLISLCIININFIFLILSVSRAATPAIILYVISYDLIFQFNFIRKHPRIFCSILIALTLLWFVSISLYHHLLLVKTHIARATQLTFMQDLFMRAVEGISYNCQNIYLFIFGNGLITNPLRKAHLEFHNNFTFIFNQLGLLGLSLYVYLVITLTIKLFKKGWFYLWPFLCYLGYSDMHYAFRTRMNWLFFAMIIFLLIYRNSEKTNEAT